MSNAKRTGGAACLFLATTLGVISEHQKKFNDRDLCAKEAILFADSEKNNMVIVSFASLDQDVAL